MPPYHIPALIEEVAELAMGRTRVVDCTIGGGGHAARLMRPGVELLAIDRDPEAIRAAQAVLNHDAIRWLQSDFADPAARDAISGFCPDFVLFDLGVSGHQIDTDARGFSFRRGVPLDMRMEKAEGTPTAAEVLANADRSALTKMFRELADEPKAARLAAQIVRRRDNRALLTSDDFVGAIRGALGPRTGPSDFARLFQAVRIVVNAERDSLRAALPAVLLALQPGGLLAVISYHSGEDRLVKQQFREWSRDCVCPPSAPICRCEHRAAGRMTPTKPIRPSSEEVERNPRARSAKLRAFEKS